MIHEDEVDRLQLQGLTKLRQREARVLLSNGLYAGAYYLIGYAVECSLKACIAKQTKKHDFPDKDRTNKSYTHDLEKLLGLSSLDIALNEDMKLNRGLQNNWLVVKDWKEDARYKLTITALEAKDIYSACTSIKNGVLPWIKKQW